MLPHHDTWDMWPVQEEDGSTVVVHDRELWMTLAAPATGHPEERHDRARIRLLARSNEGWEDLGNVFADGTSLGSREWSGSAIRRPDGSVSVFYTVAGERGEARPTFHQKVAEARPKLSIDRGSVHLERDVEHHVVLRSDGDIYLPADEIDGAPGRIKAFRDPAWFRDPADGQEYLLVAASTRWDDHFAGAVAIARANPDGWELLSPLVVADGINHEIERPHVVVHQGRYYLFFCTVRHNFHPVDCAPTGLYGFVAPTLTGPYEPLNGSGLVVRNPPAQPDRTYAWLVLPDLSVSSFVNYLSTNGLDLRHAGAQEARAQFGGTAAPAFTLTLGQTTGSASFHRG
ncbi:levansucrase [Kibdelosporangium banguiense]|uniref:Levansucrase n=1 Tax=Kibdelosporangium banguiense TaxID=1365924 RepID=A0ABS4TSK5_9PSEU|nr:glycoside hydrolase family 68 protein [Kibdelosporangium banguiense]MBP2326930.1 levansucrase [Kibdelosporangium banguiense]